MVVQWCRHPSDEYSVGERVFPSEPRPSRSVRYEAYSSAVQTVTDSNQVGSSAAREVLVTPRISL